MAVFPQTSINLNVERSYNTPFSNSTLLPLLLLSLARQKNSPDQARTVKTEYDYLVVGAGAAGSIVAARLSELPCISVLLLEAGPPPPILSDIIGIQRSFWFTDIDWQYKTAPQRHTGRGLVNRQVSWPAGKTLGGSTVLNGLLAVRGNRKDYDDWEAMGAEGWSYKDVLPYFKMIEDNRDPKYVANGYHGTGGPVTFMIPRYNSALKRAVFRAAKAIGYPFVDSNARRQTGIYEHQGYLRDGQRCSTAKAYLVPAEHRSNLDILPNAMVEKILIKNRRATGVVFSYNGYSYQVRARREVIMSAGTVNTAQLLMLSGIGPKEELQRFNIPVHADLPVGKNFMDHIGTPITYVLSPHTTDFSAKISDPRNILQFIHNRTGPLASTEGVFSLAFLRNQEIVSKTDRPNFELLLSDSSLEFLRDQVNMKPEVFNQVYAPFLNRSVFICATAQVEPRSRGMVTLQSDSPYDEPVIDPNYLDDPRDLEDLVQAMKTCTRLGNHPELKKVGARPLETLYPGCEKYAGDEGNYFRCQARSVVVTYSHPCGTAKMGDPRDPTTVVDPKLRVKDIKGLRVVDNSIMPKIIHGNTAGAAMMIGEKASDIIKETIQCVKPDPLHHPADGNKYPTTYPIYEDNYESNPAVGNSKLPFEEDYDEEYEAVKTLQEKNGKDYIPVAVPEEQIQDNYNDDEEEDVPFFESIVPSEDIDYTVKNRSPLRTSNMHSLKLQPEFLDSSIYTRNFG